MREAYYDESAVSANANSESVKYAMLNGVSIFGIVVAVLFASICFVNFSVFFTKEGVDLVYYVLITVGPLLVGAGLGVGCFFWKRKYNVSYDYSFVEDELRVSKVYNGKARVYFVTIKLDQVLRMGFCDKESFKRAQSGIRGGVQYLTPNKTAMPEKQLFYIVYSGALQKCIYVIECRDALIELMVRGAGRNKLELE